MGAGVMNWVHNNLYYNIMNYNVENIILIITTVLETATFLFVFKLFYMGIQYKIDCLCT